MSSNGIGGVGPGSCHATGLGSDRPNGGSGRRVCRRRTYNKHELNGHSY